MAQWRAEPLQWGKDPRVFEMFQEPTCPFSVRSYGKLDALPAEAAEDNIIVKLRLQSQLWHMYSGVITRCVIAASTLRGGKDTARRVLSAVAALRANSSLITIAAGPT